MKKTRIAIVCQNDKLWSLYAWNKAIPLLTKMPEEYEIAGFWVCDERFINLEKNDIWKWYLKTFKTLNFLFLATFAVLFKIIAFTKSLRSGYSMSFKSLCKSYHIPYHTTSSPNNKELSDWVKENKIDILIIMVSHILKGDILNSASNCIINKHAALLPANKGVFPYIWAYIKKEPQGISFHKVVRKIDEGEILYQEKVEGKKLLSSMISFYFYTYKNYGLMLTMALKNAVNNTVMEPGKYVKPSYHSAPTAEDYFNFRKLKGKIITFKDLFLPFEL